MAWIFRTTGSQLKCSSCSNPYAAVSNLDHIFSLHLAGVHSAGYLAINCGGYLCTNNLYGINTLFNPKDCIYYIV